MEIKNGGFAGKTLDFPFEVKAVEEDGTIKGLGSTFGGPPDAYNDIVAPGAFSKTLKAGGRNGTGVAFLWQHDYKQPLGIWSVLEEQKKGLYVEGKIATETQLGREAHILAKMGAVRGLSMGYSSLKEDYDRQTGIRTLKEVSLWEISLVTFPANTRARVQAVKAIKEAGTERELEQALRDAGLKHDEARYVVALCKKSLRDAGRGAIDSEEEKLVAVHKGLSEVNDELVKLLKEVR